MKTHIDFLGLTDLLHNAASQGRHYLFEYEVYHFIRLIGGETPPQYLLLPKNDRFDPRSLHELPGKKVVVKVISPYIMHKSDVGGVAICGKNGDEVLSTVRGMTCDIPARFADLIFRGDAVAPAPYRNLPRPQLEERIAADIEGFILCQYMPPDSLEFGNELLVSLRNTREFGIILSAGLGGRDTELFAARFRKGQAVVAAATELVDGESFFNLFRNTISYKKMAGLTRSRKRNATDAQLLECFSALIETARHFSPTNGTSPYVIEELEVNPFAFSNYLMMPLDGLCRFSTSKSLPIHRPAEQIDKLLHPSSIGIVGVSARKRNIGRIICDNILAAGFARDRLTVVHPRAQNIDGLATVAELTDIAAPLDLLVVAVEAGAIPELIDTVLAGNLAASVLLVSGGLEEQEGHPHLVATLKEKIAAMRASGDKAPVFLGANSLGILSHPGCYDAMFIPEDKLPKNRGQHQRTLALVSQSGAYMITRMSKLSFLDPAYAISIGNQMDLCASDFLDFLNGRDELRTLAFYMEGFADLDGLAFAEAVRRAVPLGKEVIFYKAGRTPEGKNALSGHTASIAGDYMVCESCIGQSGAMVAETFSVFEGLLRLSSTLHGKTVAGNRLAAISNAGYEAVGIADNLLGDDYRLEIAALSAETSARLQTILAASGLDRITSAANPLDITPMAAAEVYVEAIAALLEAPAIDVVIAAIVPLSPSLHTLPTEIACDERLSPEQSLVGRIARLGMSSSKPLVMVVDSGSLYDPLADSFQSHGLPVFRSADLAVAVLGKYIGNRLQVRHAMVAHPL